MNIVVAKFLIVVVLVVVYAMNKNAYHAWGNKLGETAEAIVCLD